MLCNQRFELITVVKACIKCFHYQVKSMLASSYELSEVSELQTMCARLKAASRETTRFGLANSAIILSNLGEIAYATRYLLKQTAARL